MSLGNRIAAELKGDRTIWMITAVLGLFSILAVYSASGWGSLALTRWRHDYFSGKAHGDDGFWFCGDLSVPFAAL